MILSTNPPLPPADSSVKPYTTHSVTCKLSFPAAHPSSFPSLGGFGRRRSSAGAAAHEADDASLTSTEYVFAGKLSVQEKSIVFTLQPSPTPYARPLGNSPPTSPQTRRLSLGNLFSRPARPISPPVDTELEEDDEVAAVSGDGGIRRLRLKRTVSKGFKDFPLFIDNKALLAFEFPTADLAASGAHITLHSSKASLSPSRDNRHPASVVIFLPTGVEGHATASRIEIEFGQVLSDDLEAQALENHLLIAKERIEGSPVAA